MKILKIYATWTIKSSKNTNTPLTCLKISGDKGPYGEPSIHRLIEALDTYIELPKRDMEAPFLMPIDNLVSVPGRGTVAIGKSQAHVTHKAGILIRIVADPLGAAKAYSRSYD